MRLILVVGPWGSGTSVVTQTLMELGFVAPGPHFPTSDPRTPSSFEMEAFKDLLRSFIDQQSLTVTSPEAVGPGLATFHQEIAASAPAPHLPIVLKHPLAALVLPQICREFDTRLVYVIRPMAQIQATRTRRQWAADFGPEQAARLYSVMFQHMVDEPTPIHVVRYPKLVSEPEAEVRALAAFAGQAFCDRAVSAVRRSAPAKEVVTLEVEES